VEEGQDDAVFSAGEEQNDRNYSELD